MSRPLPPPSNLCACGCGKLTRRKWYKGHFPRDELRVRQFWAKVAVGSVSDCWEFQGWRDKDGYGKFGSWRTGPTRAHRRSWEMEYGPIPEGLCVLHYCDNPPCVNPAHLFLGTDIDNVQDREEKGRGLTAERTFANKLTESEAREIRDLVQQGWVQQDVADAYGVGQVTVSRIFRGESWKRLVTG